MYCNDGHFSLQTWFAFSWSWFWTKKVRLQRHGQISPWIDTLFDFYHVNSQICFILACRANIGMGTFYRIPNYPFESCCPAHVKAKNPILHTMSLQSKCIAYKAQVNGQTTSVVQKPTLTMVWFLLQDGLNIKQIQYNTLAGKTLTLITSVGGEHFWLWSLCKYCTRHFQVT